MFALKVENLHKSFLSRFTNKQGKEEQETAELLRGVDFELTEGTITAVLGSNGSGKSTMFNIISGLMRANKGAIVYRYQDTEYNLCKTASYKQARIGIARLFQGSNIFSGLSVLDNMLIADNSREGEQPWQLWNRRKIERVENGRKAEAETILSRLLGSDNPLWEKRYDLAGTLSLGQQRLLAFARLLMNENATLFLLDEPCAGVNPQIRQTMAEMILRLKAEQKTVLLVEHNIDFAQNVSDNAIYLENGTVAIHDNIDRVIKDNRFKNNYLGIKTE